jgi:glycosyltransferase involved in cell wall biosynthesis
MTDVAAIIPAFNEARHICAVVRGVAPFVSTVVVVDDGSVDETAARARSAGAEVLIHERNRGKGAAVRTGLEHVLAGPFTHVLFLDGDLQHRPEESQALIRGGAASGADLVVGARVFDRTDMPAGRYWANRLGSRALSSFVGVSLRDTQCGFRLFRTDLLRRMTLSATGYEIETEMLVKTRRLGGRILQEPVSAVYGVSQSKLRPVRDTTRTCFLAVYYRFLERS